MDAQGKLSPLQSSEPVIKREVISSDKDGTLEKVWFRPSVREDGSLSEPWEVRATGRKCNELRGAFKGAGQQMLHDSAKEWEEKGGDVTITRPDGSTDVVRADMEEKYRQHPGFCISAVRPTFSVDGFGGMRREGIRRMRIRYANGTRTIEEVVRNGYNDQ